MELDKWHFALFDGVEDREHIGVALVDIFYIFLIQRIFSIDQHYFMKYITYFITIQISSVVVITDLFDKLIDWVINWLIDWLIDWLIESGLTDLSVPKKYLLGRV